jgi:hypothetical protein
MKEARESSQDVGDVTAQVLQRRVACVNKWDCQKVLMLLLIWCKYTSYNTRFRRSTLYDTGVHQEAYHGKESGSGVIASWVTWGPEGNQHLASLFKTLL